MGAWLNLSLGAGEATDRHAEDNALERAAERKALLAGNIQRLKPRG
ncbi:MAG TPA: hypothetical protein VLE70_00115 [Anaerolineae bacterium]|jgi:hypothetical protein|nr:hypothetical protein [Anaerolineae bacterium]